MDASPHSSNRRHFSPRFLPLLSPLPLLLLLPSGVSARGEATELGLQLDQTPIARELLLDVETDPLAPRLPAPNAGTAPDAERRAAPGDRASREPAALARAWLAAAPAPTRQVFPAAQGQSGGFWRWIKKHWYVPLLAAAAVGYTVSDDGSDDPSDPED